MPQRTKVIRPSLTENAMHVLEARYFWRDQNGAVQEDAAGLFQRVAEHVARAERPGARRKWAGCFYRMMAELRFLPNSPTLMNAGRRDGQLSACFVLPIEDSLEGVFDSLKHAALIHQSGGGTGFSFSRLRGVGSRVGQSSGVASGPVSFMRIFDSATDTIKQGGTRRGANMAVLRVDHPDIELFVRSKADQRSITNFNISVGVTDAFMRAVDSNSSFALRDPRSGEEVKRVDAKKLFGEIVRTAWGCGDPGLVFLDRMNFFNPTPLAGSFESTNPCGEQPLLAYESCNLGSLNLSAYWSGVAFDWKGFEQDIVSAVRFLDNVVELNEYPLPACEAITRRNRKVGLGVMGFADLLLLAGIPYDSEEALHWGERLMSFLDRKAKHASRELALERGPFPNWSKSMWQALGYPKMRNATVSTVAPTGTISMIAGCSSGIEPIFSGVLYRNVLDGARLKEVHPAVRRLIGSNEVTSDDGLSALIGAAWRPARSISVGAHLAMQAIFQRHSDSAVSKTINLPESATEAEVSQAYQSAYRMGCKGITIYRDRSRQIQVLEDGHQAVAVATDEGKSDLGSVAAATVCIDCG